MGASTVTLDNADVYTGDSLDLAFSNENISKVYHKVTTTFGTYNVQQTVSTGVSSCSQTVPENWLTEMTTSQSKLGTISVSTYNTSGTLLGTSDINFALHVSSTQKPTIQTLTATPINSGNASSWIIYVQNQTAVKMEASGVTLCYNSPIVQYTFSGKKDGVSLFAQAATQSSYTMSGISSSGTVTLSVTATDGRGSTSDPIETTISIQEYSLPTIPVASAYRSTDAGVSDTEGTYIAATMQSTYHPLDGANTYSAKVEYQRIGETAWTEGVSSIESGGTYVFGAGGVDPLLSYQVRFSVTDAFTTVTRIVGVATSLCTMFFRNGGTGVGVGKVCDNDYSFEINPDWKFLYGETDVMAQLGTIPKIYYTNTKTFPVTPVEGMIWLLDKSASS